MHRTKIIHFEEERNTVVQCTTGSWSMNESVRCVCLSVPFPLARHQNLFYSNFPPCYDRRYGMTSTVAGYRDPQLQAAEGINWGQLRITSTVASYPGCFIFGARLAKPHSHQWLTMCLALCVLSRGGKKAFMSVGVQFCSCICSARYCSSVDCVWNVMAHAQKPDFVFRRNGRVNLNRRGRQFSRLLAAEVCASAVVMLDTPCSEVVGRVPATHSIRQFPLHFPSRASPCAITFHVEPTSRIDVLLVWIRRCSRK